MNRPQKRKRGRPKKTTPQRYVDANGRAFTKVDGKFITLGKDGDPQTDLNYAEVIRQVMAKEKFDRVDQPSDVKPSATVSEVCLRFLTEHCPRYRTSTGIESAEIRCYRGVVKLLRILYGETRASDFGPLALRAVRQAMIDKAWSRKYINKQICRLRYIFQIGVSWEMVSGLVVEELETVPALIEGETSAPERSPRRAVPPADLETVRLRLRQRNRDLFDLMLLTGARPGELLMLTTGLIDKTGDIWRCEFTQHKTKRHGKRRVLFFNAKAQLILRKYLSSDPDAKLFPVRGDTFSEAIKSACGRAGVPEFTPHSLRHTTATRLVDELGLEAAQRLLGHSTSAMTEHYARNSDRQAIDAVRKLG